MYTVWLKQIKHLLTTAGNIYVITVLYHSIVYGMTTPLKSEKREAVSGFDNI